MQKLAALTRKRLDDFANPKRAAATKSKGVDISSNPADIQAKMEDLKVKLEGEADAEEQSKLIGRIQALNASFVQLSGADAGGGGSAAAAGVKATLTEELAKYDGEVKTLSAQVRNPRGARHHWL